MDRILVTGAAGFIGSAVVRKLLADGRCVRCLVQPGLPTHALDGMDVELCFGDVCSQADMRRALQDVSVVYHLAAIFKLWLRDPRQMYAVNVEGTKNLLREAGEVGVDKIIHTSSIAAVGHGADGSLSDESTAFNMWDQADHYIRSKWLSEQEAMRFARQGLPVVVVNPAFPFGEGDRGPTPTGRFIVDALRGLIPGYPPGGFNAVDVDDVAHAHLVAERKGRVGERYILGNHNLSYQDFYAAVSQVAGLRPIARRLPKRLIWGSALVLEGVASLTKIPPKITYKAARYASRHLYFDSAKARKELEMPQTPLHETIDKSVRWFRAHGYA